MSRKNPAVRGKAFRVLALAGALVLLAWPALAAPRDAAAQKKIQEAIYTHFLNMDFDTAEGLLVGTFRACEDKCSASVKAKLWMYVGIIRGAGRQDLKGAEQAFTSAVAEDADIALDAEIATPEVKAVFEKVKGSGGGESSGGEEEPSGGGGGGMRCSLSVKEVQSRRPIPIECESSEDLESAKLFYENFNTKKTTVKMSLAEGLWRGTIPCTATSNTGELRWYVEGFDSDGEGVDQFGDEDSQKEIQIVAETSEEPPAFPEDEPPARCSVDDAPPGTGGGSCAGWGASCANGGCCETGLSCVDGSCEQAQCEKDSDCEGGTCDSGKCTKDDGGGGDYAKNYFGLHFGMDVASISTDGACTQESRANDAFTCVVRDSGVEYTGFPNDRYAGAIGGGFSLSTMRILASYERLFGPIGLEVRAGIALAGGPNLMPVHAELRGKFWVLGTDAMAKPGPRLWVHLGGGLAQVDATVPVDIRDCTEAPDQIACIADERDPPRNSPVVPLDATKQLGLAFVGGGAGFMYAIGKGHGPVLSVAAMAMLPSFGFVVQPSLGYTVGF